MKLFFCMLAGYLLGSLSPATLFSKLKKVDLKRVGTKNPGAANALLMLGRGYGAAVMLLDMAKAAVSVLLARALFPASAVAPLLAGGFAILGHIFPFYMGFKGGKGLAPFAGVVLAYDPPCFFILLVLGVGLMLIVNYTYALPLSATPLFPLMQGVRTKSAAVLLVALALSLPVFLKHLPNRKRAKEGRDVAIRGYVKEHLFKR